MIVTSWFLFSEDQMLGTPPLQGVTASLYILASASVALVKGKYPGFMDLKNPGFS